MKRWQRKVLLASLTGAMWLTAPVSALADVEEGSAAEVQQEVTAGEEIAVQTIQETGVHVAVPVISKMSATVQGIHVYWNKSRTDGCSNAESSRDILSYGSAALSPEW